jgi:predicted cytidylate kinase
MLHEDMIITIAGLPGAGKTSVAKELAKRLGFSYISVGEIRGQMAIDRGITIDELNNMGTDSDVTADSKQIAMAKSKDNAILEGRISWHLIPDSFKILITVDPKEGARRIFAEQQADPKVRADERRYESAEDAERYLAERVKNDCSRMYDLYGVENFVEPAHFDFVLDTTPSSGPEQNADRIIEEMKKRGLLG